jgi:hypothetical protein
MIGSKLIKKNIFKDNRKGRKVLAKIAKNPVDIFQTFAYFATSQRPLRLKEYA